MTITVDLVRKARKQTNKSDRGNGTMIVIVCRLQRRFQFWIQWSSLNTLNKINTANSFFAGGYSYLTQWLLVALVDDTEAFRPWAGYRPPPPRGNFVHYDFLKLHYIRHKIKDVSPLRVAALMCNSTLYTLLPKIALNSLIMSQPWHVRTYLHADTGLWTFYKTVPYFFL